MPLPSAKQVRDLLESQAHREVHLRPTPPLSPDLRALTFAIYVDRHLHTSGMVMADLAATAHIGAAAGQVPVGVAQAALAEYTVPAIIADGFQGVLRAAAGLFGVPGRDEGVRLYQALLPGAQPPADVRALAAAAGRRLDFEVDVRAYGTGRLSLVLGR